MHLVTKFILITIIFGASEGLHHNDEQQQQQQQHQNYDAVQTPLLNPDKSQEYRNFLKELYRYDRDKSPTTFQVVSNQQGKQHIQYIISTATPHLLQYQNNIEPHRLVKRSVDDLKRAKRQVFRIPIFEYRQKVVIRRRLTKEEYRKKYLEHFRY